MNIMRSIIRGICRSIILNFYSIYVIYLASAIIADTHTASGWITRTTSLGTSFFYQDSHLATFSSPNVSP